jgi:hypothetical protein
MPADTNTQFYRNSDDLSSTFIFGILLCFVTKLQVKIQEFLSCQYNSINGYFCAARIIVQYFQLESQFSSIFHSPPPYYYIQYQGSITEYILNPP